MAAPITSPFGAAITTLFGAATSAFTVVNTTCSAANKLASAADRLAGWCDETAATFEEEAQFNRQLRREELMRKIQAHQQQPQALAAPAP